MSHLKYFNVIINASTKHKFYFILFVKIIPTVTECTTFEAVFKATLRLVCVLTKTDLGMCTYQKRLNRPGAYK